MKTCDIYAKWMTPKSLQEHMLRTASLAQILLDHWKGEKPEEDALITCCLFHDITKQMKFDLTKQAQYGMSEEDIKKLADIQKHIKSNFGEEEHHATIMICKEIGLSEETVTLVDHLEWEYIPRWLEANDINSLIPIYCDMRISPKGILPLETRIQEFYDRVPGENYEKDMKNGKFLESKIISYVAIDVNSITNDQVDAKIELLLNKEVV